MQAVLITSLILSWIFFIALAVALIGVARQVGILHTRLAPAGALVATRGPGVGSDAPRIEAETLDGRSLVIGGPRAADTLQLVLFVSPSCPICKELIPAARSFVRREHLELVLVGDDDPAELNRMVKKHGLEGHLFVNSSEVGRAYHIDKLPHAMILGEDGKLLAKGLVNSREHLESLVNAHELGIRSVQDYLASRHDRVVG